MSDDISKKITIDVDVSNDGQEQLDQYKAAFDSLRISVNNLSNPLATLSGSITTLGTSVSKLSDAMGKLDGQNKSMAESGNKLTDSVGKLQGNYDALGKILTIVKAGAVSLEEALTGGLAIILTFGPEIMKWVSSLFKGKDAIDKARMSINNMNQALHASDYSNAVQHLNKLTANVDLAKKGFLSKKEVLQQYNDTLGKTMGRVNGLTNVESKITQNGNAYIKMTLLKASAEAAMQDAVKKSQEADQAKLQSDEDTLTFWDKALVAMKHSFDFVMTEQQAERQMADEALELHQKAVQRRAENIASLQKQSEAELSIMKDYTSRAAVIAKDKGFDFLSGEVTATDNDDGARQIAQKRIDALNDANQMIKDALTKQVQSTYEAYGSEASKLSTYYEEELSKLKGYLDQHLITQQKYNEAASHLENEYHNNLATLMNKYNEQDKSRVQQAQNELTELRIKGMHEGSDKEIAELEQDEKEKLQQLEKLDTESANRAAKLTAEIQATKAKDPHADISELQKQLEAEYQVMSINCQKEEALEKQTADAIRKIKASEAETKLEEKDQKNIDNSQTPETKLQAEKKLIVDKYQFEIAQAEGNVEQLSKIEEQKNKTISELTDKYTQEKTEKAKKAAVELNKFELQQAKKLEEDAFSIINQSIKQASEAKIAGLEQDKEAELSNSSLTSAQKVAIQQRFKQQEAQIKIKAFHEEQEASIAQAVINGALAITKSSAQEGVLAPLYIPMVIAETAVQIAKIAAQKPPAYASGGLHYTSDGRGGLLPGYSKTDNTNAWLRSGEGVVVSEAMRIPWARNLVSAINVGFGGRDFSIANPGRGYAVGGIFTDGGDANRYYNQPVHDQKNLANSIAYQMINNFPPVYVDVKDINNQQNILAQTINRVNL